MPYSRRRPRLAPTARISLRLNLGQRDVLLASPATPPTLGHALHRAPVRQGKLSVRVTAEELARLIAVAALARPADRRAEREWATFLRYLDQLEDQFAEPAEPAEPAPPESTEPSPP